MIINSISNVNFRSVTPIFTKPGNLPKIEKQLREQTNGKEFDLADGTSLYKDIPNTGGICWQAVNKDGFDVGFLVTGKECRAWSMMEPGWTSINSPTRHIDKTEEIIPDGKINKTTLEKLVNRINEPAK